MTEQKTPKLRFREFSEDWEKCKLGEVVNVTSVKRVHQSDWKNEGVRFLRARDIVAELKGENIKDHLYISKEKYEKCSEISGKVSQGDLLVTGVGTIGIPYLVKNNDELYFKDGNIIWFQNNNKINGDFLYFSFLSPKIQSFINTSAGIGTVGTYTIENGKKTPISLPSLPEQQKIGALFRRLDQLITLHKRKWDDVILLKKALLQKMFPKNGERLPEIRFPEFTDAWEKCKLGEVADFSKGNGYSKNDLVKNGRPIILYGRLYTNYQTIIDKVDTFVFEKEKSIISTGNEVLVPASGETAEEIARASALEKSGIILGGDLNIIKIREKISPLFLAITLSNGTPKQELSKKAQGKSVVHLRNSDLEKIEISLPTLPEQQKIGALFRRLDQLITLHKRQHEHYQLLKKALLQQMFV